MSANPPDRRPYALSRADRLQHKREFSRVYAEGLRVRSGGIVLYALPNGSQRSRVGTVTSRKVGNAVARNRARRLLREAYRLHRSALAVPCDVVLIACPGWRNPTLAGVAPEVLELIGKANVILRR